MSKATVVANSVNIDVEGSLIHDYFLCVYSVFQLLCHSISFDHHLSQKAAYISCTILGSRYDVFPTFSIVEGC